MGNGWSVLERAARSKAEACGQCDGGDRGKLEDEQLAGFYTMIEESLALPFTTRVLGVEVTVAGIDLTDCGIVAICVRGKHRQSIPISYVPLFAFPPPGCEWIAAYRYWASRG